MAVTPLEQLAAAGAPLAVVVAAERAIAAGCRWYAEHDYATISRPRGARSVGRGVASALRRAGWRYHVVGDQRF